MAPEPPMSPGGVCLDPHGQAQNSHPTVSGRHWVAPGAAGRHVATSPLGTRPPRQGQCFSLGAEGRGRVPNPRGLNPRVNFDGERKVSPRARSPPFLRTTALLLLRLGKGDQGLNSFFFHRGPSRACWELLQMPYERSPRTCTAGTVALTPARCLLTEANTTLLDSTVA